MPRDSCLMAVSVPVSKVLILASASVSHKSNISNKKLNNQFKKLWKYKHFNANANVHWF